MTIRTLTIVAVLLSTVAASPRQKTYTVRKGDTLTKISRVLGIKAELLAQANGLASGHILRPGSTLLVPTTELAIETISNPEAIPADEGVVLYAEKSAGAAGVGTLSVGAKATVLRECEDWTKLQLSGGAIAWAPSSHLTISKPLMLETALPESFATSPKPGPKKTVVAKARSISVNALVARAESLKGIRYRYGGTSRSGFDCSGFTSTVFRAEGISLPRTALQQSQVGIRIGREDLKAGDLVFFKTRGRVRVSHVGIYIGDGKFIHAPSSGGRVRQDVLSDGYYAKRYAGARRVASAKDSLSSKKKTSA